jgi:hypothetical protein
VDARYVVAKLDVDGMQADDDLGAQDTLFLRGVVSPDGG